MFLGCNNFNIDLLQWDVSNSINFISMFNNCYKFNADLSQWDISNGLYFNFMFFNCKLFNSDLSKWNTKNAKKWYYFSAGSLLGKYPQRIPKKFKVKQIL
jgi:surface protein